MSADWAEYRLMEGEAAGLLAEIHDRGFADGPERSWSENEFSTLLDMPGSFALVLLVRDLPAGFVLVRRVADEAEILTLAVLPEVRRQGRAAGLLAYVQNMLRKDYGIEKVFLEVRADNAPALALYRKCGFQEVGHRRNYYSVDGDGSADALVMALGSE
ncbi:ribosomal protein S18-alanine N-acetyltransferase [Emcibacter sp.]|uniref:ribosomal protein S18-alanine N-acetyltransferase n=1 Tax=Emcibacter sp. TaxID=1979954 RepID=UPI003A8F48F7